MTLGGHLLCVLCSHVGEEIKVVCGLRCVLCAVCCVLRAVWCVWVCYVVTPARVSDGVAALYSRVQPPPLTSMI